MSVMTALDHSRALSAPASARMQVTNVLVVVNPASRGGGRALATVLAALREAGVANEVIETTGPGSATVSVYERLLGDSGAFDGVISVGGDGTAMEVASGLLRLADPPAFGIVPVGTANVLARSLGIPMSPRSAIGAILDAEAVAIDLGRVIGGSAFAIGLGVGLDAAMIGGASALLKRRIGYAAYAWSAVRAGLRMQRFRARVTVDGIAHDVDASSVLIANFGTVLGGMICFGEDIGHQDGVLDVCIYSPRSFPDLVRILWRMLFGGISADRCVRTIRGERVRIETEPPMAVQADGELLGLTPVEVRVQPSAIRVLAPYARNRRSGHARPVGATAAEDSQSSWTP